MANAVHLHARVTAQQSQTGTTPVVKQTVTAAQLAAAGFATNDDVLVLWYHKVAVSTTNNAIVDLKYGATSMLPLSLSYRMGAAAREAAHVFMGRVSLGATIGDFTVLLSTNTGTAYLEKSELVIVRLADFGTENTDWYWNKSTTAVTNTTTYSGTSRATVTWTPGSVEDWVYLAYVHTGINGTGVNFEGQVVLDGAVNSGDWAFEGEATTDEIPVTWHALLASLAASSHTLTVETRDDTATAINSHTASALLVFRRAKWADLHTNYPGTVAVANATNVQVATVIDALSAAQPLVVWGQGNMVLALTDNEAYLWLAQDTAVIDPQGTTAQALSAIHAFDSTEESPTTVLGYIASESGTQNIDLFASQTSTASQDFLRVGLIAWGMALAVTGQAEALAGTIAATSGVGTAALKAAVRLTAPAVAATSTVGPSTLKAAVRLIGTVIMQGAFTANLKVAVRLSGTVAATSSAALNIKGAVRLTAPPIAATSTVAGTLRATVKLAGDFVVNAWAGAILRGKNLVVNGDFESGADIYGWGRQSVKSTLQAGLGVGGSKCVQTLGPVTGEAKVYQTVPVTPGKTYLISASVWSDEVANAIATFTWYDANIAVSYGTALVGGHQSVVTSEWVTVSGTATAPAGAVRLLCSLSVPDASTAESRFDDVSVICVIPLAGTVAATAGVTGALTVTAAPVAEALAGTVVASSAITGTLKATVPLSGVVAAASTVSGAVAVAAGLSGAIAASSSLTAYSTGTVRIAGLVAATSSITGLLRDLGELVINGEFDGGIAEWDRSGGVSTWQAGLGVDGSGCIRSLGVGTTPGEGWAWQYVPVVAGRTYRFSAAVWCDTVSGGAVEWKWYPSYSLVLAADNGAVTGAWVTVSGEAVAPAGATYLLVQVGTRDGSYADARFDDISVREYVAEALVGVVAASSTVTGALTVAGQVVEALSGVVAATTTVAATMQATVRLAGVVAATSSIIAVEEGTILLTGTVAAAAAVTASLRAIVPLVGVVGSSSTVSGALLATIRLSGNLGASSTVVGNISITGEAGFAGMVVASATVTGTLKATVPLAGMVAGHTTMAMAAEFTVPLFATTAAASLLGATLSAMVPVSGLVESTSAFIADLSLPVVGEAQLAYFDGAIWQQGTIRWWDGFAWQTGRLMWWTGTEWLGAAGGPGVLRLGGMFGGESSSSGVLVRARRVSGVIPAVGRASGVLYPSRGQEGVIAAQAGVAATMSRRRGMVGQVGAASSVVARLAPQALPLSGVVGAQSGLVGDVGVLRIVAGPTVVAGLTTATVQWTLNEGSTGQVFYGLTPAYGSSSTRENSYTYSSHSQVISGLASGTLYHFMVVSTNADGETVQSGDSTFTTDAATTGEFPVPAPLAYHALVSMPRPSYLVPVVDANYGTEVVRVSNVDLDRNAYATKAAWNRDGSILAINFGGGHEKLLDGDTYAILNPNVSILAAHMSWDDVDPLVAWRATGNSILRLAFTRAGAVTTTGTWPLSDYTIITPGGDSGEKAGDFIPFLYQKASGMTGFAVWRISTHSVTDELDVGVAAKLDDIINNCGMSQSGEWLIAGYSATGGGAAQGLYRYDPLDFSKKLKLTANGDHWDAGRDINGRDVVVAGHNHLTSWLTSTGWSTNMFDVETGARTLLITESRNPHHSMRCFDRPGYVYISSANVLPETWAGFGSLFAVELADPPAAGGLVEYFGKSHYTVDVPYNGDPMMCVHPDGSRVIWGTKWQAEAGIFAYVAGVSV